MNTKAVADIVKSNRVSQLGKEQADNVTPRAKDACLFVDTVLAGKFGNEGGMIAELCQNWQLDFG